MRKKQQTFRINTLYWIANRYNQNMTEEEEINRIDMTKPFWEEVRNMIRNGELVDININGKVRLGKSTVGIYIGEKIYKILQETGKRKDKTPFSMRNIARDQQEKSKLMRDPTVKNTVIVTDESNELEKGGANSTAEQALSKVFSDVQAGRYVHQVACSPKEIIDNNADILLEVVGVDKTTRTTHLNLYYRLFKGGQEHVQLLGYVNICVHELIKTWEDKVKENYIRDPEGNKEMIKQISKQDFFTKYMLKKYEKMELITKEGIFRPRLLEYAPIIKRVVTKLEPLTKLPRVVTHDTVRNYVKVAMREQKIPTSLVGIEVSTGEALGILKLMISNNQVIKDLKATKRKLQNPKNRKKEELEEEMQLRNEMIRELGTAIKMQLDELDHYIHVNQKYNKHLQEE